MSNAIFLNPPNVLAAVTAGPGGVRIADALTQAGINLETIRQPSLEAMDGYIAQIEGLCAQGGAHPTDDIKLRIYNLSNDVVGIAGVFGLGELGAAAFSLCELVDCFRSLERWNQAAVMVHLSSFRLLRDADGKADHADVLDGLARLTQQAATIAQ